MSKGLKPKQVASILNIGEQKLRYWRTKLDPNPHRSEFSVPDLLAFRIIQVLIEIRHFSTQDLEKFQLIGLFEWCHVTWKKRIINVRAMDKRAKYPIQSELNIETAPSNQTCVN